MKDDFDSELQHLVDALRSGGILYISMKESDMEELPGSKEELELHMQINYKQAVEIAEEQALNVLLDGNRYELTRKKLNYDLTVLGIACVKNTFNNTDGIKLDYVDPANLVYSHTDSPYFDDIYYVGEVKNIPINELKNQIERYGNDNVFVLTARMQEAAPAIQAWLKLESKSSKVGKSGVQEGLSLGFKEKGLVGEVADFVQQIFMQKGMEKVLKHGFKNQQNIGRAGKVVQIKGPITKQELGILVKAKAKSEAKLATHVGSDLVEKEGRIRPVYMQFRGKKVEVDDLAEIENDIKEMTHGEKIRNFFPWKLYFADVFKSGGFDIIIGDDRPAN